MTSSRTAGRSIPALDDETRALVRLAAEIVVADEAGIRRGMTAVAATVRPAWVDELILQSYLFAGFPRALIAAREWRRLSGETPVADEDDSRHEAEWVARGETTCRAVYGAAYERLRHNIRALHPALDRWMIAEGYGKVLSRTALDLARRELCIVAACTAGGFERQLHAHLHGAINVGARPEAVDETLSALENTVSAARLSAARRLWTKVRGQ